jgi:hypothetical protein
VLLDNRPEFTLSSQLVKHPEVLKKGYFDTFYGRQDDIYAAHFTTSKHTCNLDAIDVANSHFAEPFQLIVKTSIVK